MVLDELVFHVFLDKIFQFDWESSQKMLQILSGVLWNSHFIAQYIETGCALFFFSMTFHAWKMVFLNSMTFHDLGHPVEINFFCI